MAEMEFSKESVALILSSLDQCAKFVARQPEGVWADGKEITGVYLDNQHLIGRVYVEDAFDDRVRFVPNGDWFGTEVERMG